MWWAAMGLCLVLGKWEVPIQWLGRQEETHLLKGGCTVAPLTSEEAGEG